MGSFQKTYFLCPTSDFIPPPPTGPLDLGAILVATSLPQRPLNAGSIVPVANAYPDIIETDWHKSVCKEFGFGQGVYAQFLQSVIGIGGELNGEYSRKNKTAFAFDKMTTKSFEPTNEYISEAIQAPAVKEYMRTRCFAPNSAVYLVTGIKLVEGSEISYTTESSKQLDGNLGVDGAMASVPVTIGPKGHWTTRNSEETSSRRQSEFVFAFRVTRLKFKHGKVERKEHIKGAFLSIGEGTDNTDIMSVVMEDVDGSQIKNAKVTYDDANEENIFCV